MFIKLHSIRFGNRERGLSLVELMVAMAIGLIGMTVMFQIYSVTEARKRSIAGNSDMDVSGRIALVALQHDIELAGYGYSEGASSTKTGGAIFGCKVDAYDGNTHIPFPLTPLIIQDSGDTGVADQIITLRGSSGLMAVSKAISTPTDASLIHVTAQSNVGVSGVQRGDLVVAVNTDGTFNCALYEITNDQSASTLDLTHANSSYTDAYNQSRTARYNNSGTAFTLSAAVDGRLYDLGPRLLMNDDNTAPTRVYRNIWAISDGSTSFKDASGNTIGAGKLVVTNDLDRASGTQQIADDVINMQTEYGVDQNNDGIISADEWVNCDDGNADICKSANLYATNADDSIAKMWASVRAIRVAILTRGQFDQSEVAVNNRTPPEIAPGWIQSGNCDFYDSSDTASNTPMTFTIKNINGSACTAAPGNNTNSWKHYRYNVFETVISLKNVAWGTLLQ